MKKALSLFVTLVVAFSMLSGCEKLPTATNNKQKELNIFTWADYVPTEVIEDFTKETGIKVNYTTFQTNEEMLAKLEVGKGQYDIIVCTDYIIDVMVKNGQLLQKLDKTKLKNFGNIDPSFQSKYYDKNNEYTIPHAPSAAVLVYDSAKVNPPIEGFADLWREDLKGKVVSVDGVRTVLGFTLQMMGESINEKDPAILEKAKQKMFELKQNIVSLNSDNPHEAIISGDATVGYMFGSQAIAAQEKVPTLRFVYPKEGVSYNIDNYVLAKDAPNAENAHIFLDYILRGAVSAKISETINYMNTNLAAQPFLQPSFLANEMIYIPKASLEKAQMYEDLGDTTVLYDQIWTEFQNYKK